MYNKIEQKLKLIEKGIIEREEERKEKNKNPHSKLVVTLYSIIKIKKILERDGTNLVTFFLPIRYITDEPSYTMPDFIEGYLLEDDNYKNMRILYYKDVPIKKVALMLYLFRYRDTPEDFIKQYLFETSL